MDEIRSAPLFDWFKITWVEGYNSPMCITETMIITNNKVSFIRTSKNELDLDPYSNINCKWYFKTNDVEFETAVNSLCLYFLNHMEPSIIIDGADYSMFTIEVKKYNDKKAIKKTFKGHLRDYEYEGLLDILEGFIPKHCFMPYFIDDIICD